MKDGKAVDLHGLILSVLCGICILPAGLDDVPSNPLWRVAAGILTVAMLARAVKIPMTGFYALLVFLPFFTLLPWAKVFYAAVFLLALRKKLSWDILAPATWLHRVIYAFWFLGLISVLRNTGYGFDFLAESGGKFISYWVMSMGLYVLALAVISDRTAANTAYLVFLAMAFLTAVMTSYDYMAEGERIMGIMQDSSRSSAYSAACMCFFLAFFLLKWRDPRFWLCLIPVLACLRAVMVVFSRGGYFAFLAGLYTVVFFRSRLLFLILVLVSAVIYVNPIWLPEGIRHRLGKTVTQPAVDVKTENDLERTLDKSSMDRIRLWHGGLQLIKEEPLFGSGFNTFRFKVAHYWRGLFPFPVHNQYLDIAAEMGIPALLAFLWSQLLIFLYALRHYLKSRDAFDRSLSLGLMGALAALHTASMFIANFHVTALSGYFWILTAVAVRLRRWEEAPA